MQKTRRQTRVTPLASTPAAASWRAGPRSIACAGLLGALALIGCSAEFGEELGDGAPEIGSLGSLTQALSLKTLPHTVINATDAQGNRIYGADDAYRIRFNRGVINEQGEVMVHLGTYQSNDEVGSVRSERGLRWNVNTSEVRHMGLLANRLKFGSYSGWPFAMNEKGNLVGNGWTCRGSNRSVIWTGENMATKNPGVLGLSMPPQETASAMQTFCNASAAASVLKVLSEEVPGAHSLQEVFAYDVNDQDVVVGATNAYIGSVFTATSTQVVIEAENFTSDVARGNHSWQAVTLPSGRSGMQASPNAGVVNNTGFASSSPRLDFKLSLPSAGTYTVWVLGLGPDGDSDSLHVGVDGVALTTSDRISVPTGTAGWSRTTMDAVNASVTIAAGSHTLNVWMREDGAMFDKLILTRDTAFVPSGEGPAESPRSFEASPWVMPYKWDAAKGAERLACIAGRSVAPLPHECDGTWLRSFEYESLRINNLGQVIDKGGQHFWDQHNVLRDLSALSAVSSRGLSATLATAAFNSQGLVVGTAGDVAWAWLAPSDSAAPGAFEIINRSGVCGSLCAASKTTASAVNDQGVVAGVSKLGSAYHVYTWSPGTGMIDRGVLPESEPGTEPTVVDINERGELVGNATALGGERYAFYAAVGELPQRMESLELTRDINNKGQALGYSACSGDSCEEVLVWQLAEPVAADVYLEAECPTTAQGAYTTTQTSRAGFSGAGHLVSTANTVVNPFNNTSPDRVSYNVSVATAGEYRLYFRAHSNGSADDDSWFYQIDNGSWVTMNNSALGGWNWYAGNSGATVALAAGAHTVRIANRENGLALDKLALIASGGVAPSGIGGSATNCGATPPPPPPTAVPDATYAHSGVSGCTTTNCTSAGAYVDLNEGAGYRWASVAGGSSGGNANLYFRVASPSATRSMSIWRNGVNTGLVLTATATNAPRPAGAEFGPFPATLSAGNNTIEIRDTQGTVELDVFSLRVDGL